MSRLPLWAQNQIGYLKRDLQKAREDFAKFGQILPPRNSPTVPDPEAGTITYGRYGAREIVIPKGEHVTFYLGGVDEIRFDYDEAENRISVHASATLEIELNASNTAFLAVKDNAVMVKLRDREAMLAAARILFRPDDFGGTYKKSRS